MYTFFYAAAEPPQKTVRSMLHIGDQHILVKATSGTEIQILFTGTGFPFRQLLLRELPGTTGNEDKLVRGTSGISPHAS